MKSAYVFLGTGLVSLLVGCASTPVVLAPVGPNPFGTQRIASHGELQVFSSLAGQSDLENPGSKNPFWYEHTDYCIYNLQGKLVKWVANTVEYGEEGPGRVALPAGRYLVKAHAKDYFWVEVPVAIMRGRTTKVHLDDNWKLPASTPKGDVVSMPNGNPVGWRAECRIHEGDGD